ncbi:MAG: AAA family ATPase [Methanolinea sp.]|jgi:DNA sulfur modification protein DndD|nr:AAA family ATPase [Methanolinea sp.]
MRLKSIYLHNYRQYKEVKVDFPSSRENDLFIFIGKNGTGKTNFLNAINWCLYNDEPHLSLDSEGLPILNTLTYQNSEKDVPVNVKVEITFENNNGLPVIFSREKKFLIENNREVLKGQTFKIIITDKKYNSKIIDIDDKTKDCVERIIPKNIREYFFFDGERLDNYFKHIPGDILKQAIIEISKVNYLYRMRDRIDNVSNSFRREAGKMSNKIFDLQEKLEKENEDLNKYQTQLDNITSDYEIALKEIKQITEELKRFPNISDLENNKARLEKEIGDQEINLENKKREKLKILYKLYIFLNSYEATKNTLNTIQSMKTRGEIPPFTDKEKLSQILNDGFCNICGRELDYNSREWISEIIKKIPISSKVAIELSNFENPINRIFTDIEEYYSHLLEISSEINHIEDKIKEIDEQLSDIRLKLQNYDIEKIKKLELEREKFEKSRDNQKERIGQLKQYISQKTSIIEQLKGEIKKEAIKNEKAKIIMKKVDFCDKAKKILTDIIDKRLNEIKYLIQKETNEIFFKLIWKKLTFSNIIIDDNYQIKMPSSDNNYQMLGTLSKAENELLALSFTLALHNVSGFNMPLLIDTPVARVSDEQRVNFGSTLVEISKNKQIILLFTPAEYSSDIKGVMDNFLTKKFEFELSSDERQTIIKEIK